MMTTDEALRVTLAAWETISDREAARAVCAAIDGVLAQADWANVPLAAVSADRSAVAERIRSTTSITADTEDLARVLEMDRQGMSRRRIAETVGIAHSTVGRWIKAAEDATDEGGAMRTA